MGTPELIHSFGPGRMERSCSSSSKAQVLPTEQHQDVVRTAASHVTSAGDELRGIRERSVSEGTRLTATSLDLGGGSAQTLGRGAHLVIVQFPSSPSAAIRRAPGRVAGDEASGISPHRNNDRDRVRPPAPIVRLVPSTLRGGVAHMFRLGNPEHPQQCLVRVPHGRAPPANNDVIILPDPGNDRRKVGSLGTTRARRDRRGCSAGAAAEIVHSHPSSLRRAVCVDGQPVARFPLPHVRK